MIELFKNRPLFSLSFHIILFFFAGLVLSFTDAFIFVVISVTFVLIVLAVMILYCFMHGREKIIKLLKKITIYFLALLLVLLEVFYCYSIYIHQCDSIKNKDGYNYIHANVIDQLSVSEFYASYMVEVSEINGEKYDIKGKLNLSSGSIIHVGDEFGALVEFVDFDTDDSYREDLDAYANGMIFVAEINDVSSISIIHTSVYSFRYKLKKLNSFLASYLIDTTGKACGSLCNALLLGRKDLLDDYLIRDFKRCGVSHLLALSGLHVVLLLGIIEFIMSRLWFPKKIRLTFVLFFAVAFLLVIGIPKSALRAVCMFILSYLAMILNDRSDSPTSLSFSVSLIMIVDPLSISDLSLWMTYLATMAICFSVPLCNRIGDFLFKKRNLVFLRKIINNILSSIVVSLMIAIFLLPISIFIFKELSLISSIMTLILVPFVYIILSVSTIFLFFGKISFIGQFCKIILELSVDILLFFVETVSHWQKIVLSFNSVYSLLLLLLFIFSSFSIWWIIKKREKHFGIIITFVFCFVFLCCILINDCLASEKVNAVYLKNGNNDSFLIYSNDASCILDISDGSYDSLNTSWEELQKAGKTYLDLVIVTQYHTKTISTLKKFCGKHYVREIWMPEPNNIDEYYCLCSIFDVCQIQHMTFKIYHENQILNLLKGSVCISDIERNYLTRSEKEILSFSIQSGQSIIKYYGNSFFELSENNKQALSYDYVDYCIFGVYGPTMKQYVECDLSKIKNIVMSNENLLTLFSQKTCESIQSQANIYFDVKKMLIPFG